MPIVEKKTLRFSVKEFVDDNIKSNHEEYFSLNEEDGVTLAILCDLNCEYSQNKMLKVLKKRVNQNNNENKCVIVNDIEKLELYRNKGAKAIQLRDFENIDWEPVMRGEHIASSYLVRKGLGLARKAQLSLQLKRYFSKHPSSLSQCFPFTLIIETWGAFEELQVDFGMGVRTQFDQSLFSGLGLRQRLEWALEDTKEEMTKPGREEWIWILKPSTTNKGADVSIISNWEELLTALENCENVREWVLQRYVSSPLLISNHKFHLRVYVVCVGALKVFMFEGVLLLLAGLPYSSDDLSNIYSHLTNTARAADLVDFQEEKFVKTLDDLGEYLVRERPDLASTKEEASVLIERIRADLRKLTSELFSAYESEYTVFAPLSNCFEVFGLDFLLDSNASLHFLEANPGPDFKQTGGRLGLLIEDLFDRTTELVVDPYLSIPSEPQEKQKYALSLVYDKLWSASNIQGGFSFS